MRKLGLLMAFAGLTFLSGCSIVGNVAAPPPPVKLVLKDGKDLWPAVFGAFSENGVNVSSADVFQNTYGTDYVKFNDLLLSFRGKYQVTPNDSGIDVVLGDLQLYETDKKRWANNNTPLSFNPNAKAQAIKAEIARIYASDSLYELRRNDYLSQFKFNHGVMKKMNGISRKAWADSLVGRTYSWDMKVADIRENADTSIKAKYVAEFLMGDENNNPVVQILAYTNTEKYARSNRGAQVKMSAKLISARFNDKEQLVYVLKD